MQAVIRLINILVDLIQALLVQRAKVKRDEEIAAIRNDPAGEFINEFGGVSVDPNKVTVPGDKASAVGDKK